MCQENKIDIPEKLEKKLPYKPNNVKYAFIVHLGFLVALILFYIFSDRFVLTETLGVSFLIVFFLMTICSFIFFIIVTFKDDQDIKFAKLNELARISGKLETISEASKTNITMQSTADKGQKCFLKRKACKNCKTNCEIEIINYKYELYKKYMDTLVDI